MLLYVQNLTFNCSHACQSVYVLAFRIASMYTSTVRLNDKRPEHWRSVSPPVSGPFSQQHARECAVSHAALLSITSIHDTRVGYLKRVMVTPSVYPRSMLLYVLYS